MPWTMTSYSEVTSVQERVEDAMREVATLLFAFAPLDAVLTAGDQGAITLTFMTLSVLLFSMAIGLERRRDRADRE